MKKFSFSLPTALRRDLQETADDQGVSMSAICREALTSHLHRLKNPEQPSVEEVIAAIPDPDYEMNSWRKLKTQVRQFLASADDLLGKDCGFFSEEYIPEIPEMNDDLFGHLQPPKQKVRRKHRRALSGAPRHRSGFNPTRFLDEIWA